MSSPRELFSSSLERCIQDHGFIPDFYNRFMSVSDEIREKFRDTDFVQQNQMLLRSLRLAAGATSGDRESLKEIRGRAVSHSRDQLNIAPGLYEHWLEAVIETAQKFDSEWNADIESAWRTILGYVIAQMIKYY